MGRNITNTERVVTLTAGEAVMAGDLIVQSGGRAWAAAAPETFGAMGRPASLSGGNVLMGTSSQLLQVSGSASGPGSRANPILSSVNENLIAVYANSAGIYFEVLGQKGLAVATTRLDVNLAPNVGTIGNQICYKELTNGNIVVTWCSTSGAFVYFCILDPNGAIVVGPTRFGSGVQVGAASTQMGLVALIGGGFAMTAVLGSASGFTRTCMGVYTNTGAVTTAIAEIETNGANNNNTIQPKMVALVGGGFGIFGLLDNTNSYKGQTFNAAGTRQGSTFTSGAGSAAGPTNAPVICRTSAGGWVAFYYCNGPGVRSVAFTSAGAIAVAEWITGVDVTVQPYATEAFLLENGIIVVVYGGVTAGTTGQIVTFNAAGSAIISLGTNYVVSSGQAAVAAAQLGNNMLVVTPRVSTTGLTHIIYQIAANGNIFTLGTFPVILSTGSDANGAAGAVSLRGYGINQVSFALYAIVSGSSRWVESYVFNASEASLVGIAAASAAASASVPILTGGSAKYKRSIFKRAVVAMPGSRQLTIVGDSVRITDYTPRNIA